MIDLKVKLDREERSNYTLIIDVSDLGSPQQQTSTVLTVVVEDEDDHVPQFNRQRMNLYILSILIIHYIFRLLHYTNLYNTNSKFLTGNSVPMEIEVREELPMNSPIGQVKAVDEDIGENADIEYAIVDGNDDRIFEVSKGSMCL